MACVHHPLRVRHHAKDAAVLRQHARDIGHRSVRVVGIAEGDAILGLDPGKRLGIAPEKIVLTLEQHGNTSAASVPLALDAAVKDGRIKKGDLVMVEAMGGGFTWGAALLRW